MTTCEQLSEELEDAFEGFNQVLDVATLRLSKNPASRTEECTCEFLSRNGRYYELLFVGKKIIIRSDDQSEKYGEYYNELSTTPLSLRLEAARHIPFLLNRADALLPDMIKKIKEVTQLISKHLTENA